MTRESEEPVGTAEHRVLVVNDRGDLGARRREHRRHGRIAAEADGRGRLQGADQPARGEHAATEAQEPAHQRDRSARQRRRRDDVNRLGRKILAVALHPVVGGEVDAPAACPERDRQCLRREEVSAGTAGAEEDRPGHFRQAMLSAAMSGAMRGGTRRGSGRWRVNARSNPMPNATATIEDPP